MSADDDRAAFEKWAEGEGYHLDPDIDCPGEYENVATRDAWVAWQAAIAAEREACASIDFGPIFDALQDHIIAMRDARMSMLPAPNGIVVCEKDGKPSSVVRMTTRQAVQFIAERVAAAIRARGAS